jgi:hypothetical protein
MEKFRALDRGCGIVVLVNEKRTTADILQEMKLISKDKWNEDSISKTIHVHKTNNTKFD